MLRADRRGIGGQPRGLTTLFFSPRLGGSGSAITGVKANSRLYTAAPSAVGGLGITHNAHAGRIVGLLHVVGYLTPSSAGGSPDRIWDCACPYLFGGIIIAWGIYRGVVIPSPIFTQASLLIALGTGGSSPTSAAMVRPAISARRYSP